MPRNINFTSTILFLLYTLSVSLRNTMAATSVVHNHDGHVEDMLALMLLACSKGIELDAVTVTPGDCYKEPATIATKKYLDYLLKQNTSISASNLSGTHEFPAAWRETSFQIANDRILKHVKDITSNRILGLDAPDHLVKVLSGTKKYVLLETGPLSNLAAALHRNPNIKKNIEQIFIMGGAVRVNGSVDNNYRLMSAEWNIYNNPAAAATVLGSGIPITLIPLDATNSVPITPAFVKRLAMQKSPASKLAYSACQFISEFINLGVYYFWDSLAATALLDQSIITTQDVRVTVVQNGNDEGRTIEDKHGHTIKVAFGVDAAKLHAFILQTLQHCSVEFEFPKNKVKF